VVWNPLLDCVVFYRVLILVSFVLPEAAGTETECNYPSKTLHRKKGELGAFDTCPEAHGTAKTSG